MPVTKINIYFLAINNETKQVLDTLREAHLPVKIWISERDTPYLINNRIRDIQVITYNNIHELPNCYRWDIDNETVCTETGGINHLLARITEYGTKFICVDSMKHAGNRLVLFHDSKWHDDHPDNFYKLKVFNSYSYLKEYLDLIPEEFSLKNNPRFSKTTFEEQGVMVYLEKITGYYWYLDNLHKNHYEVFDANGKHIGEADMNGNINTTKKDKNKQIKL